MNKNITDSFKNYCFRALLQVNNFILLKICILENPFFRFIYFVTFMSFLVTYMYYCKSLIFHEGFIFALIRKEIHSQILILRVYLYRNYQLLIREITCKLHFHLIRQMTYSQICPKR